MAESAASAYDDSVDLPTSLRVWLNDLEPYVADADVTEVLVAGKDRVLVTRNGQTKPVGLRFSEAQVRGLAARLIRAMGSSKSGQEPLQQGMLGGELSVHILGAVRGRDLPIIRIVRPQSLAMDLDELLSLGRLSNDTHRRFKEARDMGMSLLITGRGRSGKTALLAALARTWQEVCRVAVLEAKGGGLARVGIGHFAVDPEVGAPGAAALGADVVVADTLSGPQWLPTLLTGCPFVTTLEARDVATAVRRLLAMILLHAPHVSRSSAEALIESSVGWVVDVSRVQEGEWVRSIQRAKWRQEALVLEKVFCEGSVSQSAERSGVALKPGAFLEGLAQPVPQARNSQSESRAIGDVDALSLATRPVSDIRPEQLVSRSFVLRLQGEDAAEVSGSLHTRVAPDESETQSEQTKAAAPADGEAMDDEELAESSTWGGRQSSASSEEPEVSHAGTGDRAEGAGAEAAEDSSQVPDLRAATDLDAVDPPASDEVSSENAGDSDEFQDIVAEIREMADDAPKGKRRRRRGH